MCDWRDPFENRYLPAKGNEHPDEWEPLKRDVAEWAGTKWIGSKKQKKALAVLARERGVRHVPRWVKVYRTIVVDDYTYTVEAKTIEVKGYSYTRKDGRRITVDGYTWHRAAKTIHVRGYSYDIATGEEVEETGEEVEEITD